MGLTMEPCHCHIVVTGHEAVLTMVPSPAVVTVTGEGAVMLLAGAASLARRLVTGPGSHLAHIATADHVPWGCLLYTSPSPRDS